MVERLCGMCGKSFRVKRCKVAQGGGLYCSRQCAGRAKVKAPAKGGTGVVESKVLADVENMAFSQKGAALGKKYADDGKKPRQSWSRLHAERKRVGKKRVGVRVGYILQQDFSLGDCPWRTGAIQPVRYDEDYYSSPDVSWGF